MASPLSRRGFVLGATALAAGAACGKSDKKGDDVVVSPDKTTTSIGSPRTLSTVLAGSMFQTGIEERVTFALFEGVPASLLPDGNKVLVAFASETEQEVLDRPSRPFATRTASRSARTSSPATRSRARVAGRYGHGREPRPVRSRVRGARSLRSGVAGARQAAAEGQDADDGRRRWGSIRSARAHHSHARGTRQSLDTVLGNGKQRSSSCRRPRCASPPCAARSSRSCSAKRRRSVARPTSFMSRSSPTHGRQAQPGVRGVQDRHRAGALPGGRRGPRYRALHRTVRPHRSRAPPSRGWLRSAQVNT